MILGRKGSGKSLLARSFLKHPEIRRSIAIDSHGEYGGVQITDPWALSAYLNERNNTGADRGLPVGKWDGNASFRIAYRDKGEHAIPLPQVFEMLQKCKQSWIAFEESSQWVNVPQLNWFLQYGRHNEISVLLVARRPKQEVGPMGRAQSDVIVSFRQQELADLEWIAAVSDQETADRIAALPACICVETGAAFDPACEGHQWEYVLRGHAGIEAILEDLSEPTSEPEGEAVELAPDHSDDVDGGGVPGTLVDSPEEPEGNGRAQVGPDRSGPAGGVHAGGDPDEGSHLENRAKPGKSGTSARGRAPGRSGRGRKLALTGRKK